MSKRQKKVNVTEREVKRRKKQNEKLDDELFSVYTESRSTSPNKIISTSLFEIDDVDEPDQKVVFSLDQNIPDKYNSSESNSDFSVTSDSEEDNYNSDSGIYINFINDLPSVKDTNSDEDEYRPEYLHKKKIRILYRL